MNPPPLRILVVEDDALVGMLLADMLADMGHTVCGVESTEAGAVAAARRQRPDLMIVDVRLGAGSGLAAVAEILRGGRVAHVLISGAPVRAATAGTVVLHKPFAIEELQPAMLRALAVHAANG